MRGTEADGALAQEMARHSSGGAVASSPTGSWRMRLARFLSGAIFFTLLALILLVAIPYGTVEPWWEALFEALVFALGALWIIEGVLNGNRLLREHKIFLPILLLALYALIQTLPILPGGETTTSGLKVWNAISADPYETRLSVVKLLALTLCGAMLLSYSQRKRRLRALIYTLIAVGLASALFGILRQTTQHSRGFFLPFLMPDSGYGQFINRNSFAYLMEMTLGLTLGLIVGGGTRREHVLVYVALALPIWTALILCNSRGGIMSMLAQVIFLAILFSLARPKREGRREEAAVAERSPLWRITHTAIFRLILIVCLVATIFVGAVWMGGEALTSRLETVSTEVGSEADDAGGERTGRKDIWRATWAMIKDHPLVGVGFNGYWAAVPLYHNASGESTPQQAHNDYLELLASGGVVGALFILWFLALLVKGAARNFRSKDSFRRAASMGAAAGLFGVAVHSTVDFGLHVSVNALVFTALTVVAVSAGGIEDQEDAGQARDSKLRPERGGEVNFLQGAGKRV